MQNIDAILCLKMKLQILFYLTNTIKIYATKTRI